MRALSLALLFVTAALPVSGQDSGQPAPPDAAETAGSADYGAPAPESGFDLDLESLELDNQGSFRLFGEPRLPGTALGGPYYGPGIRVEPGDDLAPPPQLTAALVWDQAEIGKARLRLFNLKPKTWDDLDTWEKIGYVTAQASAVAGVIYLLDELVH